MRVILLGAPGVGKGTQADLLSKKMDLPQISTGDIFRYNLKNETPLGKAAKEYMNKGLLVPDEITVNIVQSRLIGADCKNGFILDGFPRTLAQSKSLDKVVDELGIALDCVINFDLSDEEIIKRLAGRRVCPTCGKTFHIGYEALDGPGICNICNVPLIQRNDDKEETVTKRLQIYHEQTEPLIDYYQRKNILVTIDATGRIDEISFQLIDVIENISFLNKCQGSNLSKMCYISMLRHKNKS